MSETVEKTKADKPEYKFRLSENYAIDTDPRNIILLERYETREGRGKNSPLSGQYKWKHLGYYHSFDSIADALVDLNVFTNEDKVIEDLFTMADEVKQLKKEMAKFLNDKIEVKLN